MKEAIKILETKGFHIENQFDGWFSTLPDTYELYSGSECVMDHLTEAQVIQLSKFL